MDQLFNQIIFTFRINENYTKLLRIESTHIQSDHNIFKNTYGLIYIHSPNFVSFLLLFNQMTASQQPPHQPDPHHQQSGPLAIFFIFFGLLCGALLRQVNKKIGIPYTPMLLVLGIMIGYFRQGLGLIGESAEILKGMSPHMILLVFIPILIFESAFNCDWHVFRKSLFNILLLAGPGVLWGAIIIAFFFKVFLGYGEDELSWYQACALGCVLSATDPVAVVALLKELGASVKFNTLVQGQSLLNDGTAMVFFMLFMSLVKGQDTSVVGVLANFVRVSIGGPILGLIIGFLVSFWMKKIIRDAVLSVMVTFIGTFLCFYIAEFTWVKVSGILSICTLGLYFSAVGKRKIYPESQHALHNVWASIQYGSETIIFILTGVIVGVKMVDKTTITGMDWFKMLVFWVLMIVSRVIMVLTFYPFLKRSGYGITTKQLVVLIYGGLRGALGMCLSLFVGVDESLRLRFRQLTVFYMCGMAMLTIIVNGLTCNKLVAWLEMIKVPQIKSKLLQRCLKRVLESTQDKLKQLKSQTSVSYAKWRYVQKNAEVNMFGGTFFEKRNTVVGPGRDSFRDFDRKDIIEEIRFRLVRYLQRTYWEYYDEGEVSEESIEVLNASCKIACDQISKKLRFFQILSGFFDVQSVETYLRFRTTPIIGNFITRSVIHKIYFIYQVSTVFIQACEQVMQKFQQSFPAHPDHLRYVLSQINENIQSASSYVSELQNSYPTIIQAVHTERATTILLKSKKNNLKSFYQQGYIDDKDYSLLRQEVDHALVKIRSNNIKIQQIKFSEVITQCPIFSALSQQEMIGLRMKAKERTYQKGNIIVTKGSNIPTAVIIITGSVKQQFQDFYLTRSIGNILNPFDFTFKQASKCMGKARNSVKVLQIEEGVIAGLLNNNIQFRKQWYKSLFIYCIHHFKGFQAILRDTSEKEMRRFIEAGQVIVLNTRQHLELPKGGFLFAGQVQCERNTLIKGNFIPAAKTIKALTECVLIKFKMGQLANQRRSVINEIFEKDE